MYIKAIGVLLLVAASTSAQRWKSLKDVVLWNVLEYGFPSDVDRQYAIDNGLMTNNTGTPIDVDIHYANSGDMRVFITIPRFTTGIPYTLSMVSHKNGRNGPILEPYPNYELQKSPNAECNGITSAFRTRIDECNQMWVIDSGIVENVQMCPPQLHIIDLNTNRIKKSYKFSTDVYTPVASLLISLAVDIRDPGKCQKAMVYITDVTNHGLIVYDSHKNEAWRIENRLLYPDPDWGRHTVAGESFTLMDGPFAVNLSPRGTRGDRYLFFHSLASQAENAVPLSVVNNRSIWKANSQAEVRGFEEIGRRGVQVAQEAMDSRGNLYGNTNDPLTLFVWNINTPYMPRSFKVVGNNPEQLQFASGMKVIWNPNGYEELWVITCRFQKIATGTQNPNEINFRVMTCRTDDLLSGRGCSFNDNLILPYYNPLNNDLRFK